MRPAPEAARAGELILGLDVGTYSTKGVLCTPGGTVVASHVVEHGLSVPRPGWAEHDADGVWWAGCTAVCRALLAHARHPGAVRAVALSAIGPAVLPVDARGRPLRPAILYGVDTRAMAEIADLTARYGADTLLRFSGSALTTQAVGPKIVWLRRHEPEVVARTRWFHGATSYLVYRLTGEIVMDRYTASAFTPLFDLRRGGWSDRFAPDICPLDQLPPLRWSSEIGGAVTDEAAAQTGLAPGTPVTAGTVDAMAEAISVGVIAPGDVMLMYGSTTFFIAVAAQPVVDSRLWAYSHALQGLSTLAAGMSTTGSLTRWLRDVTAADLVTAEAEDGTPAYTRLTREAEEVGPGSMGLVVLPYFSGGGTPVNDPAARGVIAGLTLAHRRGHLYRAALEGVAYGIRHNLETMAEAGASPAKLVAVGGGARSALWVQIVSDVSGVPQDVPAQTIGAAYGDAFLAALATGLVPGVESLTRSWVRIARRVEPIPAAGETYAPYYAAYHDLHRGTLTLQHTLSRLGAAGR
ncbi:MAG: FGGY-family carbohydrate kinase [Chloroflexota bacterium]